MKSFDETVRILHRQHRLSTFDTAGGSGWSCSCGREVHPTTGYPTPAQARARGDRHLRAEFRKIQQSEPEPDGFGSTPEGDT